MRRILLILLAVAAACTTTTNSYFAPTAAVVARVKIPDALVADRLRSIIETNEEFQTLLIGAEGKKNRADAQREVLTNLIHAEVLTQEARRMGIEVTAAEVEESVASIEARFGAREFRRQLREQRLTIAQVREETRINLLVQKITDEIAKDVEVPEEQIQEFYNQNKAQFDRQYHIAHILVCANLNEVTRVCTGSETDEAEANGLADRAKGGEDFTALAKEHSDDPSAGENGGDLGWSAQAGATPTPFESAAQALEVGEVSDPVLSQSGWHIIQMLAKGRTLEDARDEIREQLAETPRRDAFTDWLREAITKNIEAIRVNSRYGRFDASTLRVVPLGTASEA